MSIKEKLDKVGPPGNSRRLKVISEMDLGSRSEAAKRVLEKRRKKIKQLKKLSFFA